MIVVQVCKLKSGSRRHHCTLHDVMLDGCRTHWSKRTAVVAFWTPYQEGEAFGLAVAIAAQPHVDQVGPGCSGKTSGFWQVARSICDLDTPEHCLARARRIAGAGSGRAHRGTGLGCPPRSCGKAHPAQQESGAQSTAATGVQQIGVLSSNLHEERVAKQGNAASYLKKDGVGGKAGLRVGASGSEGVVAVWPCSNAH